MEPYTGGGRVWKQQNTDMGNDDTHKKFIISIAIKILIVIGVGTAIAYWHLANL
jgi:flagellar basal body-associated protein FliL